MSAAMRVAVGESFSETIRMTPEDVQAFAKAANDLNPIHYDETVAAQSRYKRLIASGTQVAARLMALTANYFTVNHAAVGLDFSLRFHKAVFADETIVLEWRVTEVVDAPTLGGELVHVKGRVLNEAGEVAVTATGRLLVTGKL